ncbi:MAG TPA: L-histidine N(alpha)-methyltransferase [Gemmataceae bacterium]|jgi:dimethylhistidine N-methyltransferase|nr:L-histidine N(alpha)-methyltransferase [Gemmataceae bacterium]
MIAPFTLSAPTYELSSALEVFRRDVLSGLARRQKTLPCKYFYDDAGARLFEEITRLPEYYLTRTELGIMERHAADMAALAGRDCLLIEYGSGSSLKTRYLLRHLDRPAGYVPIDISQEQLYQTAAALGQDFPGLEVQPLCADFTAPVRLPESKRAAGRQVVYFPGSTIGNFTVAEAIQLLRRTAKLCSQGGGILLGVDLKKDPRVIEQAYNDSQFVTAAFNRNLLTRINRELDANFQVEQYWHHAFYDPLESRIAMHLVSQRDQEVRVASKQLSFAEGESIRTEYSYKYSPRDLRELAAASGFHVQRTWVDENRHFIVSYLTPVTR